MFIISLVNLKRTKSRPELQLGKNDIATESSKGTANPTVAQIICGRA